MSAEDETALLFWRNLITQWHLDAGLPDCGCDDDTTDADFCPDSVSWADEQYADRDDPDLSGPVDSWSHDVWRAAWGRNAPLIADLNDYRLPLAPAGTAWLATRCLMGGRCVVELVLYKLGEHRLAPLAHARVFAEPTTVQARARALLQALADT